MLTLKSIDEFLALLDKFSADELSKSASNGLQLTLSQKQIGDVGAAKLAEVLESGRCPSGLQLDLSISQIHDAGAAKLAEALSSGRCPQELKLDLSINRIGAAGAAKMAQALSCGRCPSGLQLNLGFNEIGEAGLIKLGFALSSGRCPPGLHLDLSGGGISETTLHHINKLLKANEKRHTAMRGVAFFQGLQSSHSQLKKLPVMVAKHIFSFVLPPIAPKQKVAFLAQVERVARPLRLISDTKAEEGSGLAEKSEQKRHPRMS